ncbi:GST N-terminal domain-containing protein [Fusarium sp. LHS14.1]|nr:GST N-terminal domain-containing protein [Fusarium sp. LHS14.1]
MTASDLVVYHYLAIGKLGRGEVVNEYEDKIAPQYYDLIASFYADREGPYLLGDAVSYADFAVYVSIDNDARTGTLPATLPASLARFQTAFEARPNIADYVKQG